MDQPTLHATELLKTIGFVLTKFSSNSKKALENLNHGNLAPPLKTINLAKDDLPQ